MIFNNKKRFLKLASFLGAFFLLRKPLVSLRNLDHTNLILV